MIVSFWSDVYEYDFVVSFLVSSEDLAVFVARYWLVRLLLDFLKQKFVQLA